MDLSKLSKIRADKLFPEFLSEEDKRQISLIRAKSKRRHEELHEGEDRRANIISEGEFNLQSIVGDLIDPKTGKMRELVDTRDLAEAKNFYDYCYRILGSDIHAPWAVQMWLAAMSLGEVCPKCTNPKYLDVRNIDKSLDSRSLNHPKRMTFLEHGVCPRCGATKRDLIQSGLLPTINQAVWTLGQRCVAGETLILTQNGIARIGDLLRYKPLGYSVFVHPVFNGESFEKTSQCYVADPESLYRIELSDGGVIECTGDHPLMTSRGWKKASDLSTLDSVEILVNTNCYGDKDVDISVENLTEIPADILSANHHSVFRFILSLYRAIGRDGAFVTSSFQLAQDLRVLLYNMGVYCHIESRGDYYVYMDRRQQFKTAVHVLVHVQSITRTEPKPTYDLVLPKTHRFVGNAIVNHNSGKSSTSAVVASYVLHRYLMYPMLSSMTNSMQASTELVIIFCSLTYQKAYDVMWTPFKNIVDQSQWFKSYFAMLDSYAQQYGKELYINSKSILAFANKNIRCYPTGPTASKLRGNTSIMTLMDELGLFPLPDPGREVSEDDTNRRADSDEAYTSLLNSLATVGAAQKELITKGNFDAPPCLMLSVSSPISKRDKVMRLLEESKTNPYIFGAQLATWEVNPFLDRDSPLIASAFAANERRALRDFGAVPTETSSPFFDDNVIDLLFTGRPNSHVMQYVYSNGYVWGKIRQANQYDQPTVIALDAGLVNNSFAVVAVGYDKESQTTQTVCALEVMATGSQIIDFQQVYSEIILPLAQALNCVLVVADRWNSVDHLHRIRADRGERNKKPITQGKQYSLKLKDFEAVRTMIQNKAVTCPKLNQELEKKIKSGTIADYKKELIEHPIEHLALQFLTVTDMGKLCPGKAEGYTDDILRAWVLAVTIINKEKVQELIDRERPYCRRQNIGLGVAFARRSF